MVPPRTKDRWAASQEGGERSRCAESGEAGSKKGERRGRRAGARAQQVRVEWAGPRAGGVSR